ncbi:ATP-binding cassette domain-containing protein [Enterococcus cecorum]|uniref:ATP-binding cassette domain-containing protein n=1 Tax=Enterococcus cecorum TaxID=44008 RepID=UPI000657B7D3|nr:ABC transporter ATP-binding protein [Enterococcus cecorum]KLO65348.1 hypothetical protein AA985_08520 [Enterococcus cecorum]CAI3423312.1 ABC transporter ATP-binding protein [Enterococcus cecorum]CAI3424511.1 ABC transporter ATP-binding protein [Enterococcus cecorum]CAI3472131.1 ABC transporter ATP-binding protein [Enterococcus cecorum]CAI3492013.1 ABC transporter ATP-binding protein [Enterococcus cecorum]
MSHNHLEVKNLNYSYPNHTFALKNIQMSLKSGYIYGLVGKNGAGKTTLLDNLAGYYSASYPYLLYNNEPFTHELIKNNLGYLETNLLLYDYLTIDENMRYICQIRRLRYPSDEMDHLIEHFELTPFLDRPLNQLSKGTLLKVHLIMTLIHQPAILLLDEPFDGLDPTQVKNLQELLIDYAHQGKIVLVSSHVLAYLTDLCNEIFYMQERRITADLSYREFPLLTDFFQLND